MKPRISYIKRAQKESLLLREISKLYQQASLDDTRLQQATVSRVKLSKDKSLCTVYFYAESLEAFKNILPTLTLYKPSLRKALASTIKSRYTPNLLFAYDELYDNKMNIESLFESIKDENSDDNSNEDN